jgi:tetratricopeptide (TPR) repeat protein
MAKGDAQKLLSTMAGLGLNVSQGPNSDVALADEFDHLIDPYCEWLKIGVWDKAVIAWKEGTRPESVIAHEGWDPKIGSGLVFQDPSSMQHLEFLRLDGNVEVFLNKKTDTEVYIGRSSTPVDSIFLTATPTIQKHDVSAGQPALNGSAAMEVAEAVKMLEKVVSEVPNWWNAQWFYGKGQLALGEHEAAYRAFRQAYDLEKTVEMIPRELAGVCLELRRFDEAAEVAKHAVGLDPENSESLGNLALAYLLAGRNEHARKAIDAAIKAGPSDRINQTISRILLEIAEGRRAAPESLSELSKPVRPKKNRFFSSWLRFYRPRK